jgi:hypothetical protein
MKKNYTSPVLVDRGNVLNVTWGTSGLSDEQNDQAGVHAETGGSNQDSVSTGS